MIIKNLTLTGGGISRFVKFLKSKVDKEITYERFTNKQGRTEYLFKTKKHDTTFNIEFTTAGAILRLNTESYWYRKTDMLALEKLLLAFEEKAPRVQAKKKEKKD